MIGIMNERDRQTGRYTDTRLTKLCVCGHALGQHTADKQGPVQPCLAPECECECFTTPKKRA
jgi:hypothetical protein